MNDLLRYGISDRKERTMDNASFDGYSDYDTFAVAFWIDNEPQHFDATRDMAGSFDSTEQFAEWLREYVDEYSLTSLADYADVSKANYLEIAGELQKEI